MTKPRKKPMFGKLKCKILGHKWKLHRGYSRTCERCSAEEAVFVNRWPRVGQPYIEWRRCLTETK